MTINSWGSDDPAEVGKGGTGNSTLTDHGILLGSGTAAVTPTGAPTDGQLLIGNTGSDPSLALPTGDSNEISITGGSGTLAIGIADNPVIPGNESITITTGTTGQEPSPVDGMLRYDTTTNRLRAVINGVWTDISTGSVATGAWVYLTTQTASGSASVAFDSTYITSTYDAYVIVYDDMAPTSGSTSRPTLRFSPDNGSTIRTTNYSCNRLSDNTGTSVGLAIGDNGMGTTDRNQGVAWIWQPTSASIRTNYSCTYNTFTIGGTSNPDVYGGRYETAEAHNYIQIVMTVSSANFNGNFHLYGISTS